MENVLSILSLLFSSTRPLLSGSLLQGNKSLSSYWFSTPGWMLRACWYVKYVIGVQAEIVNEVLWCLAEACWKINLFVPKKTDWSKFLIVGSGFQWAWNWYCRPIAISVQFCLVFLQATVVRRVPSINVMVICGPLPVAISKELVQIREHRIWNVNILGPQFSRGNKQRNYTD